jgi:hypothetical protein
VAPPEILAIPTTRLTAPSSRDAEEESTVKQGIVNELVQTGQWSGTRPSVINSLTVLIARIGTLIKIHQRETIGEPGVTVYWNDCIKYGGVSQAWSSRKAGKAASVASILLTDQTDSNDSFRTTYNQLLKYKDEPSIQALLTSAYAIDIKTTEAALAEMESKAAAGPSSSALAPPSTMPPVTAEVAASGGSQTSRRRSTPEWSASPDPVEYSEMLDGGLTPLASSETTGRERGRSGSVSDVDELADLAGDETTERPAKLARLEGSMVGPAL